jgi:isoquinoline 1-oxidoreductase subunit beta
MTHMPSRRALLQAGLAAGGGLLIGLRLPGRAHANVPEADGTFMPNAFIRIAPDESITLIMSHVEVGQGVYTSASMLIAEELEVGLDQVKAEHAPPNNALYTDPTLGEQATGGSSSTLTGWVPLRQAGAAARTMLVAAAAAKWHVDPATCTASHGLVTHTASGRSLSYGKLASAAALLPVPKDVPLKPASEFKLIGTPQKRLDTPARSTDRCNSASMSRCPA